ncbi:MAG: glycosyltransferase family 4 protein [Chloroflexota bacterium]
MADRVLAVSVAPLFPDAVHGGSQRVLLDAVSGLAEAGADVRVACGWRPENEGGFQLQSGAPVEPLLRLKGYFPEPWEAPPHLIARTARALGPWLSWADVVYLHADTFYLRWLIPEDRRVVRSFHDFHYENALVSAFAFNADLTIVPSEYLRRCISSSFRAAGARMTEPIQVIPNGIDTDLFKPAASAPPGVAPRRRGDTVLLFPHRPDPRKGIDEALQTVALLSRRQPDRRFRLLIPRHLDAGSSAESADYYENVVARAREAGIQEAVEFVPWFPHEGMASLYTFADATLCIGSFIESFGLTAYESLACGTPVVSARVGALRHLPEHPDVHMVEQGDTASAADAVAAASDGMRDASGVRKLISERYALQRMKKAYAEAIVGSSTPAALETPGRSMERLAIAPWCHPSGGRVYHDYYYGFLSYPSLAPYLASSGDAKFSREEALAAGVSETEIGRAEDDGVLVPS